MNDNYHAIEKAIEVLTEAMSKMYKVIEDYLQNIFNAPSTINRVLTYYAIGYNPSKPNKRYVYFNGVCILVFELEVPSVDLNFGYYRGRLNDRR